MTFPFIKRSEIKKRHSRQQPFEPKGIYKKISVTKLSFRIHAKLHNIEHITFDSRKHIVRDIIPRNYNTQESCNSMKKIIRGITSIEEQSLPPTISKSAVGQHDHHGQPSITWWMDTAWPYQKAYPKVSKHCAGGSTYKNKEEKHVKISKATRMILWVNTVIIGEKRKT